MEKDAELRKISRVKISQIVKAHNLWVKDANTPGANKADLRKVNLSQVDLRKVNLSRADLRNANLNYAYLSGADLSNADLSNARLYGTKLYNANLSGADLSNTDLRIANLINADLSRTKLTGSSLFKNDLTGTILYKNDLSNAKLRNTDLSRANLSIVDLRGADLTDSLVVGINISSVSFDETILNSLKIDHDFINKVPKEVKNKWQDKWFIQDFKIIEGKGENIIRSIEFTPEYKEAGMAILSYFGTIISEKYHDVDASISIKQEKNKIKLIIETYEGNKAEIERTLDEYGMVVMGKKTPEEFLSDPFQVQDLKNQLRLAYVQLEQKKELMQITEKHYGERIQSLESEVRSLNVYLGNALQTNKDSLLIIDKLIDQNANIRNELIELKKLLENPDPSENDKERAVQLFERIKIKEPGAFQTIKDTLLQIGIGATGSIWGSFFIELAKHFS